MEPEEDEASEIEATEEQIGALRELGVPEDEIVGMSVEEADDLIAELRARRQDAGRFGRA